MAAGKPKKGMRCRCGRPAAVFRKYEGRPLCRGHFIKSVEDKVKRTVGKEGMIKPGDRIAVALSGGKNSSAAMKIMNSIAGPRRDMELFAITVDEGVRGYSKPAVEKARELCRKLGVNQVIVSFGDELGKTMDQKVRELKRLRSGVREPLTVCAVGRRMVLNRKARELGATRVCTGHNLDAEVQAIMLNYMRGDMARAARLGPVTDWSTKKAGGKSFVPRIKPLRMVPEEDVELYARLTGLVYHKGECPLNATMRDWVAGFVDSMEKSYPGMRFNIIQTFDKLLPAVRKSVKSLEGDIRICPLCGEPCSEKVCKACQLWRA